MKYPGQVMGDLELLFDIAGNLFRVRREYTRRKLCVKKNNVPYLMASCAGERMRKRQ
jgi:hypothetical protein